MSRIWDRVAGELYSVADSELDKLRDSPEFVAMGSDIERAFAAYFIMANRFHGDEVSRQLTDKFIPEMPFVLMPQYEIGPYRVDFLFSATGNKLSESIVIECDGHDFHEKTKEQAARDKARDRFLSERVGAVLRFSGSEFYRSTDDCWYEASMVLMSKFRQKLDE